MKREMVAAMRARRTKKHAAKSINLNQEALPAWLDMKVLASK
jgi:hypothetical protein